jgi:hypothetical protein
MTAGGELSSTSSFRAQFHVATMTATNNQAMKLFRAFFSIANKTSMTQDMTNHKQSNMQWKKKTCNGKKKESHAAC